MAREAGRSWFVLAQRIASLIAGKARYLLAIAGVNSIGVGWKRVGDRVSDTLCVQITVDRKLDPDSLKAAGLQTIPDRLDLDGGGHVATDVVERRFAFAHATGPGSPPPSIAVRRRSRLDAVAPGISIGRRDREDAGTLGAIVFDRSSGAPLVLSNAHVLAEPGSAGDPIVQPGSWDDERLDENAFGTLLRSHLGSEGDGAVASIGSRTFDREVLELGVIPVRTAAAALHDHVVKSGRTTGVTFGVVTRSSVLSRHRLPSAREVEIGGFEIGPDPAHPPAGGLISDQGDSGSLWLACEDDRATQVAVGLHFAFEIAPGASAPHALACDLQSILSRLDASLAP